eukprot:4916836-Lingulodinium_polyedra.AAC.1
MSPSAFLATTRSGQSSLAYCLVPPGCFRKHQPFAEKPTWKIPGRGITKPATGCTKRLLAPSWLRVTATPLA